uniref:Envelope polyprotein n=1 Tax=Astatotilapia calliptera TaxID=8154 RepID=A0AAX7UHM8_ASTCA
MPGTGTSTTEYMQKTTTQAATSVLTSQQQQCKPPYMENHPAFPKPYVYSKAINGTFNVRTEPGIQHPMCFNFAHGNRKLGRNRNCSQTFRMPQDRKAQTSFLNGTYWVQGTAWACGSRTYFTIPPNSTGLCAPILVSDHTFRVFHQNQPRRKRNTDDVQPHDPIWGSDVPAEFKLWTTGQKVLHSLFPWVGTGKNTLRIETLDYQFGLFLNSSTKMNKAQNEEIDAIRIVVMQHRVALDMILAERGGLCVLFNTTCCTYISDNVQSLTMTTALDKLRQLSNAQQQDYVMNNEDWLTWLLSGSWKTLVIKGLVLIGVLLLLLCLFSTCILPCIRSMIDKMVQATVITYVGLPLEDEPDEEDLV